VDIYKVSFFLSIDTWLLVIILLLLMLACIKLGEAFARRRRARLEFPDNPANSAINGAVFGLLAFLLAFTFSMSGNRYDDRRQASIVEANAIGTAILRADLYPDSLRQAFLADFKNYLQARIDNFAAGPNIEAIKTADKQAAVFAARLWSRATGFAHVNPSPVISGQMIPALNDMFDSATSNTFSELIRVPTSIVFMLFALSLISSFFMGYISVSKGRFDWFTGAGFCVLTSLVIFITLDLDRPRRGLIQLDTSHGAIISLMNQFEQQGSSK